MMNQKIKVFIIALLLMSISCRESNQELRKPETTDLIHDSFPESQREIELVMKDITNSIVQGDEEKLISFHVYGPKFTEFRDGAPRSGSEENEQYERGFIKAITKVNKWETEDLKIDVFGEIAKVTFHANFQPRIGENDMVIKGQVTLIFVKVKDTWKITHEHFSPLHPKTG